MYMYTVFALVKCPMLFGWQDIGRVLNKIMSKDMVGGGGGVPVPYADKSEYGTLRNTL